jgi:hypothetical protein
MNKISRIEAKAQFKDDVDAYGKPKKMISKLNKIFDYVEDLEQTLAEHKRLHTKLNEILHQKGNAPTNPTLCDLISYVEQDLKARENK